jgi:ABC-type dipeptide/oligopeptide/nickel transport system permease component
MTPAYLLRRLLHALPTLFGVVLIVFVLLRVVPGDPIAMMVVGEASPEDIANLRALYGLDKSLPEQFVIYLGSLLRGDFGVSISLRQDVLSLVLGRLPATLELALVSMLASTVLGVLLALAAVHWRATWVESAVDALSALWLSIPEFLWAMLLIILLGVLLPVLPISGRIDPTHTSGLTTQFYLLEALARGRFGLAWELVQHLILPATALSLPLIAVIARVLKASLAEALAQDYILLARVKGFDERRILTREALPNALGPMLTVAGVHFVFLVGGTVLVELIFSYPGIGNMLYTAAVNRDLPLIQGVTIVFALLFILLNLAIDLVYPLVNPRVRHH